MEFSSNNGKEKIERELSRLIGYRLLGWSIISLWAVAVVTLFRVFKNYPPAIDTALLVVAPLLAGRALVFAMLHKQLRVAVNIPSFTLMRRYSLASAVFDGLILLAACVLFYVANLVPPSALAVLVMASLASLSLVYMFTPKATIFTMALVAVPAIVLVAVFAVQLPMEFLLLGLFVLLGTGLGVNQFKSLYLGQLRVKFEYEAEMFRAAESNFIFNQHWQKMQVAAIDWDRDCVIKSWNPAAEKLFGFSAAQAQGQSLELLLERDLAAAVRSEWQQGIPPQSGATLRPIKLANGSVPTLWYDTPLYHDGELIGIASFIINGADPALAKLAPASSGGGQPVVRRSQGLAAVPSPSGVKAVSDGNSWGGQVAG